MHKVRRTIVLMTGVVVSIVVAMIVASAATDTRSSVSATMVARGTMVPGTPAVLPAGVPQGFSGPPPDVVPLGPITASNGVPAITPTIANAAPGVSAYSDQDARKYLANHYGAKVSVTQVTFESVSAANAAGHVGLNYLGDQLVCVVKMSGNWTVHAVAMTTLYEAYDAHTGNLLAWTYSK